MAARTNYWLMQAQASWLHYILTNYGEPLNLYTGAPMAIREDGYRLRPGDQQLPVPNDLPHIHDLVIEDIKQRKALGTKRYGTPLQPFNGRDPLRDVYEELLDAAAYIRQLIAEQEANADLASS